MSLLARIHELGGAAATHELSAIGATRERLRVAVRLGDIRRIRQGWYIDPDTPRPVANALRVGGRATCVTAAEHLGLWTATTTGAVHVAVAPHACQLRDPGDYRKRLGASDAVVHWNGSRAGGSRLHVPVAEALLDLARCFGPEAAFVATESALVGRMLTLSDWRRACAGADASTRLLLGEAGLSSGSITESTFVFRMRRLGIRPRQQVQIGPDRVDVVIGDRLVIELDGREFHERERDYARDARLGARGYRVLRFAYRQVFFEWPSVEAAVLAAIARGDHR